MSNLVRQIRISYEVWRYIAIARVERGYESLDGVLREFIRRDIRDQKEKAAKEQAERAQPREEEEQP